MPSRQHTKKLSFVFHPLAQIHDLIELSQLIKLFVVELAKVCKSVNIQVKLQMAFVPSDKSRGLCTDRFAPE